MNGVKAWACLFGYVAAYDVYAVLSGRDTLSEAFHEAVCHPIRRWPTIALWGFLTAHLFHLVPENYDPLRRWPRPKTI